MRGRNRGWCISNWSSGQGMSLFKTWYGKACINRYGLCVKWDGHDDVIVAILMKAYHLHLDVI
jgi:hypothetical protein